MGAPLPWNIWNIPPLIVHNASSRQPATIKLEHIPNCSASAFSTLRWCELWSASPLSGCGCHNTPASSTDVSNRRCLLEPSRYIGCDRNDELVPLMTFRRVHSSWRCSETDCIEWVHSETYSMQRHITRDGELALQAQNFPPNQCIVHTAENIYDH